MSPATLHDAPGPFHPASSPDYVPREPLFGLQSHRLRRVVGRAYEQVARFRQRMHQLDLTPADIHDTADLAKLPFTVKDDLSDAYPFDMFAVPLTQVARLHPPSGATGKPIVVAHTRADLDVWTELLVRCLASCGIHQGDLVQNACGYNLFTDGLALHAGVEALGATAIPISGGDTDHQVMVMKDFGVSAICSTPGYFLYLIERAEELGVDLRELPLRIGVFVADTWSEPLRRRIEESAGIRAYGLHGLPEMLSPGIGAECHAQSGLHIFEDYFYPEIIDPETGQPVEDGHQGELVLTTLGKEAMPLIRYRTPDLAKILPEPCPCGRTMRRIQRIARQSDEMFVLRGVNVFPARIEAALLAVEGTLPSYQIVLSREKGLDRAEVQIEVTAEIFSDQVGAMEKLQNALARQIEQAVGIHVPVRLVEPRSVERGPGDGPGRVLDLRET